MATPAANRSVLIRNARIHPVSGPVLERGSILVEDGRIKAVGAYVAAPQGAEVVDAVGLDAYLGFMDAGGVLGLLEVPTVKGTVDTSDPGTFLPQLQAATALHFESDLIPISRVNGVTHALAVPGQGGGSLLPGQASAFRLGGRSFEAALEALTLAPARMFGLDKDLGTLEPGKEATFSLVQWNPLDFSGDVKAVYIQGVRMPMEHRHRQLLEKFGSGLRLWLEPRAFSAR